MPIFCMIWNEVWNIDISRWIDEKNVNELIRPWYCKALNFPLNLYYPGKFERQAHTMFEALYPTEDDMSVIENQVFTYSNG